MKFTFTTILSLFLALSTSAQNKQSKKPKSSIAKTSATEAIALPAISADSNTSVDTIHITKGKPALLLINVMAQNTAGYRDTREEKEILTNFDKSKLQIISITRHSFIVFENNQTLDISNFNNSYESKAFWNGKIKEQIQTEEGLQKSTEFFAKQMKVKKESSYVINAKKYKKELAQLTKKNIITDKSKKVMLAFLQMFSSPILEDLKETKIFNQDLAKIKEIKAYFSEKKVKKFLWRNIEFNQQGQPILFKSFKENNKIEAQISFEYENGMLSKISQMEIPSSVTYNDDKMIISKKMPDGEETKVYWLENDELLEKEYQLATDDNLAYNNTILEDKFENNCKIQTYNDQMFRKICFSKKDEVPFIHTFTSYQGENILQHYKVKLIKKNETTFERYLSESEDSKDQKENYKLFGTYQLNEKKQITSFKFIKDKTEKNIKIDYTYFQ
ncbi:MULTISPECIES: hypothetical protein [Flavobacterium]|uniref:DUF4412 domain-containing protein n=1 Tax=Flavobacterium hankyongi TaxID=1176532 RepID=A0ABP8ZVT2_9FLAO|nr:hypothetical protein [Flavobacterium sp. N1846]